MFLKTIEGHLIPVHRIKYIGPITKDKDNQLIRKVFPVDICDGVYTIPAEYSAKLVL